MDFYKHKQAFCEQEGQGSVIFKYFIEIIHHENINSKSDLTGRNLQNHKVPSQTLYCAVARE